MAKKKWTRKTEEQRRKELQGAIADEALEQAGEFAAKKIIGKKGLAKLAAKATATVAKVASFGLIAKVAVIAVCAVVAVGIVYYGYTQISNYFNGNTADGDSIVEMQSPSPTPSQNATPTPPQTQKPTETPSDPGTGNDIDPDPVGGSDSRLDGNTYVDTEYGALFITFSGNEITLDMWGDIVTGTYKAENGIMTFEIYDSDGNDISGYGILANGAAYSLDGDTFTLDGQDYVKQ